VKLSNLQIGYTLPKLLSQRLKIDRARIFCSIDNLLTLSGYNPYGDPEIGDTNVLRNGFDGGRYPSPITVVLGLSLQF
jgi:hypothetical protein